MSTTRNTLTTLLEICKADIESARIALAQTERKLAGARDREKRIGDALDSLRRCRADECEGFDRRIEQLGAKIAEIQLFEERLAGLESEAKRLAAELADAHSQSEEAETKARAHREELNERLVDQKLLSERLLKKEAAIARRAQELEWDERDALAVRRHKEGG